jgi:hypothetical protein
MKSYRRYDIIRKMAKNKKNGQKAGLIIEIISLLFIFLAIFSLITCSAMIRLTPRGPTYLQPATKPITSAAAWGLSG